MRLIRKRNKMSRTRSTAKMWGRLVGVGLLVITAHSGIADDTQGYDRRLEQAVTFYLSKDYADAIALLTPLTESEPKKPEAFLWLGKAQARLNNWSASRAAFEAYTRLRPSDAQGFKDLAESCERQGEIAAALISYRKAAALEPANSEYRAAITRMEVGITAGQEPSEPSAKSAASKSSTAKNEPVGERPSDFWHQGIMGLLGARTKLWIRVLGLIFFVTGLIQGARSVTKNIMEKFPVRAPAAFFVSSIPSVLISYILFWGLPISPIGWSLLALCMFVGGASAVAQAKQQ